MTIVNTSILESLECKMDAWIKKVYHKNVSNVLKISTHF